MRTLLAVGLLFAAAANSSVRAFRPATLGSGVISCRMSVPDRAIAEAADIIRRARRIVIFTGAGMSADSGIATFRQDSNSIWGGLRGTLGLAYFGTPLGWRLTPGLAWRLYLSEFYAPIAAARPHGGFEALARLERVKFDTACTVITMNVDQLHEVPVPTGVRRIRDGKGKCPDHRKTTGGRQQQCGARSWHCQPRPVQVRACHTPF